MTAGKGKDSRGIYRGNRRRKVQELIVEGHSQRRIAGILGIGKSTVARDVKWLKHSEHLLRAQDMAQDIVEGEILSELGVVEVPTNIDEYRQLEAKRVIEMVAQRKTYEQIADILAIGRGTVLAHVNAYLDEYGDWGGRSQLDWRNEHLVKSYQLLSELEEDMRCQPISDYNADGDESGWQLTPFQAGRIRQAARKQYAETMKYQAQLLQLLVQKTEIDIEKRVMVVKVRNVDMDAFPPQDAPPRLVG